MSDAPTSGAGGISDPAGSLGLKLPEFEGPLDLLLHLIRVNELNIHEIPIVEITRQYDQYLGLMEELDLHVAGEYLVMAATLLHIKSKTLLPRPESGSEAEEDPRAGLVQQLLEYERLTAAAERLRGMEEDREEIFLRQGDPLESFEGESLLTVSLFDLLGALKGSLERYNASVSISIDREEFSMEDKQEWLLRELSGGRARRFQDLLGDLGSRAEQVVTFLALLELLRLRRLMAAQRSPAGEILIMLRQEPEIGTLPPGGGEPPGAPGEEKPDA